MSSEEALARSERLARIQSLLLSSRSGFTSRELAARCQVCRRTIQRDLCSLGKMGLPLVEEGGRYRLLAGGLLPPIRLHLEEAAALFIAARLLSRSSDECNPWVVGALEKLASVLPPRIGDHVQRCAEEVAQRGGDRRYSVVFGTVARAWARRRNVRIWYRSAGSEHCHDYVVAPYLIEPSAIGFAAYLIGYASYFESIHTFKLERIERAEELEEEFVLPPDFDGLSWIGAAWGVMGGGEIERVVLRFAPAVARRVRETVWHASQELESCPDGAVLCRFTLSEPKEMVPWLRGWGGDVEVLEPPWLRERIATDLRRAAAVYYKEGAANAYS